jgi:hypothetical protein
MQRAPYFPAPFRGIVQLDTLRMTTDQTGEPVIIAEMSVVDAATPEGPVAPGTEYGIAFLVGSTDRKYGYNVSACKRLITVLWGKNPNDPQTEQELETAGVFEYNNMLELLGERQPLRGRKALLETSEKKTKGGPSAKNPRGVVTEFLWHVVQQ